MKLLLDENLSYRLVDALQPSYPGSTHVDLVGLRGADDVAVWAWAHRHEHVVLSKDDDFRQLAFLRGAPPKVILLGIGNAGNAAVLDLLDRYRTRVTAFLADSDESVLVLLPV